MSKTKTGPNRGLIEKAMKLQLAGELAAAAALYRDYLAGDPGNAGVHHNLGVAQLQMGDVDEAERCFRTALRLKPDYVDALNNLGSVLRTRGCYDEAIERLRHALRIKPDHPDVLFNLGNALHKKGDAAAAVEQFSHALRLRPDHFPTIGNLAAALLDQGNVEEAAERYAQALRLRPQNVDMLNGMGLAQHKLGRLPEALEWFEKAVALQPDHAGLLTNMGTVLQELGSPDAAIIRYRQALEAAPDHAEALNNLGILLGKQKAEAEAIECYEKAIAARPDFHMAYANLGNLLIERDEVDAAIDRLQQAIELGPDRAETLIALGRAHQKKGDLEEAERLYERALVFQPDAAEALNNLGVVLSATGRHDAAVARYEEALSLRPDYLEALNNIGVKLTEMGELNQAVGYLERALHVVQTTRPNHPDAYWNQALALLLQGRLDEAWPKYEWRWKLKDRKPHPFKKPMWDGERLDGRTILLHAEQGLGDSIQFVRYAGMVKQASGATVAFACAPSQRRLFETAEGIDRLITTVEDFPDYDRQIPLLSLPMVFRTDLESIPADIPYLRADKALASAWQARLADAAGLKVGIVWRGNPTHQNDGNRSIPLEVFRDLLRTVTDGVTFVGIQKDSLPEELAALGEHANFVDASYGINDFADTAAIIANLDVVISVDSAVAHLAGALGAPVWTLLPFAPDWRWMLDREDSPWYPTMRLVRQSVRRLWPEVMERLATDLRRIVAGERGVLSGTGRARPAAAPGQASPAVDAAFEECIQRAVNCVPAGAEVASFGPGEASVRRFLPHGCRCVPETQPHDVVLAVGHLEGLDDPGAFLRRLGQGGRPVVVGYCPVDKLPDLAERRRRGWRNHLSREGFLDLCVSAGLGVQFEDWAGSTYLLARLMPRPRTSAPEKTVAVVSFNSVGNFGDRLGTHLLNAILPPNAVVTHLSLHPCVPPPETFDLTIVGIGNSVFGHLFSPGLLSLVKRSRAAIGIFGTQYHDSLPRRNLDQLVSHLDHWFARHHEDVLRYGRAHDNVSHLGDWLIAGFPMARGSDPARLDIGAEIIEDLPLDRTIERIQRHRHVFSTRIHPLLCALTSAETVGYREQREYGVGPSGKFRGLFLDIFGRTFPEDRMWAVDRDAVIAYKTEVTERIAAMARTVGRLLNGD